MTLFPSPKNGLKVSGSISEDTGNLPQLSRNFSELYEFRFDADKIFETILKRKASVVGLQFPEGLKRIGFILSSEIESKTGVRVLISGNPCFGACDIDINLLEKVDVLFHFGHAQLEFTEIEKKVVFVEMFSNVSVDTVVEKAVSRLNGPFVVLVTTVQHVGALEHAAEILKRHNLIPVISEGDCRIRYPGQVLGCNFSSARNACRMIPESGSFDVLYIGSGKFHPIGVSLSTGKRVLCADPYTSEVSEINIKKHLMKRSAAIGNSMNAETFGILVSTKNGQMRLKTAESIRQKALDHGKNAYIICMDLITPDQLLPFRADAFVNTACPRLAIDDSGNYPAPVLTPQEFEILIGEREWENLVLDEILENERV